MHKDRFQKGQDRFKWGMSIPHTEVPMVSPKGYFMIEMRDAETNDLLHYHEGPNIITLDAGIHAARLFKDNAEPPYGINMLAVGTGASGAVLNPDAPDNRQRKLNTEITRKAFATTSFIDSLGGVSSVPTNVVDFTTTFAASEAVGSLNEMGVICSLSANPLVTNPNPNNFPTRNVAVDLTQYDVLVNYFTMGVIVKPATAILTITWRLTW